MARSDLVEKKNFGDGVKEAGGDQHQLGSGEGDLHKNGHVSAAATKQHEVNKHHAAHQGSPLKLLYCAAGIFISFFVFGIFQERITRGVYGTKDRFHCTLTLVLVQCIVNALFAKFMIYFTKEPRDLTPHTMYGMCSISYLGAMLSSNQALQYVNYPTQVLGKSCKPIPVMLFGVLFAHRRYPLQKYLFVLTIVVGVAIFFYEGGKKHSVEEQTEIGFGEALLLFSLFMDGVTGTVQERIRHSYKARSNSMMLWMNIFSSIVLFFGICLTGEIFTVTTFVMTYPQVIEHMITFAVCSALGQYFIFLTVADFGPLPCSIITTTRKFFTILVSVIFFNNPISSQQWIATFLVFLGLVLDSRYGKSKH